MKYKKDGRVFRSGNCDTNTNNYGLTMQNGGEVLTRSVVDRCQDMALKKRWHLSIGSDFKHLSY